MTAPSRSGISPALAAIVVAVVFVATSATVAAEKSHTVRPGESASAIAKKYYGQFERSELLLKYNGKSDSILRVGEVLDIPYCPVHRVRPGDTWSEIAQRYLGRMSAYPAIAALNGMVVEAPLRVGSELTVPVVLSHRLQRGETLVVLAERYYEDGTFAAVLQEFNAIEDPRKLSVGAVIEIPVVGLELSADPGGAPKETAAVSAAPVDSAPEPEARSEPVPEPAPVARFAAEIEAAATAFREGEYELARKLLEGLRPSVRAEGNDAEKSDLLRLLTFVYVAFDLQQETCEAWTDVVALDSPPRLDPDLVSPKILEAVSRCQSGGASAGVNR